MEFNIDAYQRRYAKAMRAMSKEEMEFCAKKQAEGMMQAKPNYSGCAQLQNMFSHVERDYLNEVETIRPSSLLQRVRDWINRMATR